MAKGPYDILFIKRIGHLILAIIKGPSGRMSRGILGFKILLGDFRAERVLRITHNALRIHPSEPKRLSL
jgi:hypothetical protein